uniref:BTB_2 domain-containing protein n=1 Tax=Strongyloides papillosus TaxID=174720 RepID=A0A0N5CAW7_STREA
MPTSETVLLIYGGRLFIVSFEWKIFILFFVHNQVDKDILKADSDSILSDLDRFARFDPTEEYYCLYGDSSLFDYILSYLNCKRYGFVTARVLPSSVEVLSRLTVECTLLNLNELKDMAQAMLSCYMSSGEHDYEKVYLEKVMAETEYPPSLWYKDGPNLTRFKSIKDHWMF